MESNEKSKDLEQPAPEKIEEQEVDDTVAAALALQQAEEPLQLFGKQEGSKKNEFAVAIPDTPPVWVEGFVPLAAPPELVGPGEGKKAAPSFKDDVCAFGLAVVSPIALVLFLFTCPCRLYYRQLHRDEDSLPQVVRCINLFLKQYKTRYEEGTLRTCLAWILGFLVSLFHAIGVPLLQEHVWDNGPDPGTPVPTPIAQALVDTNFCSSKKDYCGFYDGTKAGVPATTNNQNPIALHVVATTNTGVRLTKLGANDIVQVGCNFGGVVEFCDADNCPYRFDENNGFYTVFLRKKKRVPWKEGNTCQLTVKDAHGIHGFRPNKADFRFQIDSPGVEAHHNEPTVEEGFPLLVNASVTTDNQNASSVNAIPVKLAVNVTKGGNAQTRLGAEHFHIMTTKESSFQLCLLDECEFGIDNDGVYQMALSPANDKMWLARTYAGAIQVMKSNKVLGGDLFAFTIPKQPNCSELANPIISLDGFNERDVSEKLRSYRILVNNSDEYPNDIFEDFPGLPIDPCGSARSWVYIYDELTGIQHNRQC